VVEGLRGWVLILYRLFITMQKCQPRGKKLSLCAHYMSLAKTAVSVQHTEVSAGSTSRDAQNLTHTIQCSIHINQASDNSDRVATWLRVGKPSTSHSSIEVNVTKACVGTNFSPAVILARNSESVRTTALVGLCLISPVVCSCCCCNAASSLLHTEILPPKFVSSPTTLAWCTAC